MAPAYIMSIYVPVTAVSFLQGRFRSMQGRTTWFFTKVAIEHYTDDDVAKLSFDDGIQSLQPGISTTDLSKIFSSQLPSLLVKYHARGSPHDMGERCSRVWCRS